MRFDFTVASCFLLALAVQADRPRKQFLHRFHNRVERHTNDGSDGVEYSPNWAGAVWAKNNGTFMFITGKFTIPKLSGENGASASAWVGIDGDGCGGGLLQVGADFAVVNGSDDETSCDVWCEWYPALSYYWDGFKASVGNVIRVNITVFSPTSGLTTIENLSNGQLRTKELNSTYELCGQNAEWIVEDFSDSNGHQLPFANFGSVTFTDAEASGPYGTYTPEKAQILDIRQGDQILTSTSVFGSSVTVTYV